MNKSGYISYSLVDEEKLSTENSTHVCCDKNYFDEMNYIVGEYSEADNLLGSFLGLNLFIIGFICQDTSMFYEMYQLKALHEYGYFGYVFYEFKAQMDDTKELITTFSYNVN